MWVIEKGDLYDHLRKMMLEELERRHYAQSSADAYIHALKEFAKYYDRPPDQLGPKKSASFSFIWCVISVPQFSNRLRYEFIAWQSLLM